MTSPTRRPALPPPPPVLRRPLDGRARTTAAGIGVGVAVGAGLAAWYLARILLARERVSTRASEPSVVTRGEAPARGGARAPAVRRTPQSGRAT